MLEVECSGSSYEIGLQHGIAAKDHIARGIAFYQGLFKTKSNMDWSEVTPWAEKYMPYLSSTWPAYVAEMEGIAAGAGVPFLDILAMNVRSEIAFGAFCDGCTAIYHKSPTHSLLTQNWDWDTNQSANLLKLTIKTPNNLTIGMITEAGIIGKIGLNSLGVGCTLNALKAKGVSFTRLPCHLALRTVLESPSRAAAIASLEKAGVASSCHILVADKTGGTGLECSSFDIVPLEMNEKGVVAHTNHYVLPHLAEVIEAPDWLPDTRFRLSRAEELLEKANKEEGISATTISRILEDEREGMGASICRSTKPDNSIATLFRIVMDLDDALASVTVGRPSQPEGTLTLLRNSEFEGVENVKENGILPVNGHLPKAQEVM